ncbi:MAG: cation transporter dimerization domain-containing protein [Calditrichia bacterium]
MVAPPELSFDEIQHSVEALPHVQNIHHVHVWTVGENDVHFEAHVNIDDMLISQTNNLRDEIEKLLGERFGINHVTLQFECEQCTDTGLIKHAEKSKSA